MVSIESFKRIGGPFKMKMVVVFLGNSAIAGVEVGRGFFNGEDADIVWQDAVEGEMQPFKIRGYFRSEVGNLTLGMHPSVGSS